MLTPSHTVPFERTAAAAELAGEAGHAVDLRAGS